ncbi:MAG: biotin--[acetyl-CoA-carboxylase] ligase [Deltaproteobacteria bacterium]|nr:biotin--[acetyl-CoA-carboxylase] ligase [Deltaproteobacteria bacterium]
MNGQKGPAKALSYEPIDPGALSTALGSSLFSVSILHHESIDSTNALAKELALKGAPEGTLVLAEEQTAGRGRRGRTWVSPAGGNLLFSILLRPFLEPGRVFVLTMILALETAEALRRASGLPVRIKWPNDLYLGGKKLAGILTECSVQDATLEHVILGMGVNLNWHPPMEEGISHPATSLLAETGKRFSRKALLVEILKGLECSYGKVLQGEIDPFYTRWNELSLILGRAVTIESESEILEGRAVRIDETGALILETPDGSTRRILCGDVSLRIDALPR